jgi:hypothetical protein
MKSNIDIPDYLAWCRKFKLTPCSPTEFLVGLNFAAANELPFRGQNALIWFHDINETGKCRSLVDAVCKKEK